MVMLSANTTRDRFGAAAITPGMGTKITAPETRASTNQKRVQRGERQAHLTGHSD